MDDREITFMDALLYAMEGEDPSKAIENQERRGQQDVVQNQRLPRRSNDVCVPFDVLWEGISNDMEIEDKWMIQTSNIEKYTKNQYKKMGIRIIEKHDTLFWNVELPIGWCIKATDHSMWNALYDNKGRKRASFFYKASFYDRDAFIKFDTKFKLSVDHVADISEGYDIWSKSDYQGIINDGDAIIYKTNKITPTGDIFYDEKIRKTLIHDLEVWMDCHYPNYKDINAYWD